MNNKRHYIKLCLFIAIIAMGCFILWNFRDEIKNLDVDNLTKILQERREYAVVIFILGCFAKPFLIAFPSAVLSLVSGTIFGPIKGFLLSMLGFFISGTIAFFISRKLGREFVERILKGKLISLDKNMETKGFKILFLLRLPPILPYDPLSYACGLTNIKYKDFILASLLGVIPETLCYCIIGKNVSNPLSPQFIIPVLFIIIATISSGFIFKKRHSV